MTKVRRGSIATLAVAGLTALSMIILSPAAANATAAPKAAKGAPACVSAQQVSNAAGIAHIGGLQLAQGSTITGGCHKPPPEPPFNANPPLLLNVGGCPVSVPCYNSDMMMTASTGPLYVTPIFWNPTGFPMTDAYKNIITGYLNNVAKMSGQNQNVYSVANEYSGANGQIQYNLRVGPVVNDTNPLPLSGCTLESTDTTGIYADGSGYSACLDDLQLQAEVESVRTSLSLPSDLTHIYVLYLPKGVESCFNAGPTDGSTNNACSINNQPTAAYCAYHSIDGNSAIYANMVYPIYGSPTGFTCGTDARFAKIQSPNGNPDADTEISPTSHEIIEAITDPDTNSGYYTAPPLFQEIGDLCAYVFGSTRGPNGGYFNQVINGGHYITQTEFSNKLFASSGGTAGCVQGGADVKK